MGKVLIVYFSSTGHTQRMAEYIAEGVRFGGQQAVTKKTAEIETADDLTGYDGYIFGTPTYSREIPGAMKTFLSLAMGADLEGKLAGAFGSYTHGGDAPGLMLEAMEDEHKMRAFDLGPFKLLEADVGTQDAIKACHDYGMVFGEKLVT